MKFVPLTTKKKSDLSVVNLLSGGCGRERQALLHCFGLSVVCAAMQMCLTVRMKLYFVGRVLHTTFVFLQWCASEAASCPRHQTLDEDMNFGQHVTAPLKKHFVSNRALVTRYYFYSFENHFVHLHKTEHTYWLALVCALN